MRTKALLTATAFASLASSLSCFAQETAEVAVADMADLMADAPPMPMPDLGGAGLFAMLGLIPLIIIGVVSLLLLISMVKILSKAGLPGIGAIVPIWNVILLCKAAGKPAWWFLLLCIPGVNLIVGIIVTISLAAQFGKGAGFGLGLVFLPIVFYPILAFGSAQYGGMELPNVAGDESGPMTRPTTGAVQAQSIQVEGGSYTLAAWLAIIATLCILAVLLFQYLEYSYYGSHDPRHGLGSVWPAKVQ